MAEKNCSGSIQCSTDVCFGCIASNYRQQLRRSKLLSFVEAPMRLLRLQDVEIAPRDRVFRHSRMRALIDWLAGFAATAALFFNAYTRKWPPGYLFGSFLLLFVLLTLRMVTARFHPSNWLVRMNETGIYVQYRSYLNYQLPADDPSVVFFSPGEIASARLVKERVETPDPAKPGATQTQYLRYIEIELSGDTALLADALNAERGEQAPLEKRWYGTSSTLYRDYPVTMTAPMFLRIRWDVVPGAHKFLDALRPYMVIADPVSLTQDFTHLKSLNREDQQKQLRELAARGQTITAIYAASKLYGCSLGEAKKLVEFSAGELGAAIAPGFRLLALRRTILSRRCGHVAVAFVRQHRGQ